MRFVSYAVGYDHVQAALVTELDAYLSRLSAYRDALQAGDADTLMQSFSRASQARSRWQPNGNHLENDE